MHFSSWVILWKAITPFTNDPSLLRKGVERATSGTYSEFIPTLPASRAQARQSSDPAGAAMAQMMKNMLLLTRHSELAQTGRSAILGLLNAVREQYRLPGRKSILFFSPGFGIPQGMEEP